MTHYIPVGHKYLWNKTNRDERVWQEGSESCKVSITLVHSDASQSKGKGKGKVHPGAWRPRRGVEV
jgi:hypothetical protein